MSKGIAALSYLPQTSIEFVHGSADQSVQSIKGCLKKVAQIQADGSPSLVAIDVICNGHSAYANSLWEITSLISAEETVTLVSAGVGDSLTVNGNLYTGVSGAAGEDEFDTDGDDTATALELIAAIEADTRVGTVPSGVTVSAVAGVITVVAAEAGIFGNTITLAETGTTITIGAGVLSGGIGFQCTFQSEVSNISDDAKGRTALSTRRLIDLDLNVADNTHLFSIRSVLSVINFIEKLEDKVAETGNGAEGDDTYTDAVLKGATPYETFTWTITKLANLYTVTPTATS